MKTTLVSIIAQLGILFIVLFDVDSAQVGLSLIDNVPAGVINIASVLGNLLWIVGLVAFAGVGFVVKISESDYMDYAVKHIAEDSRKQVFASHNIIHSVIIAVSAFAAGSGFWFYGSSIILLTLVLRNWAKNIRNLIIEDDIKTGKNRKNGEPSDDELLKAMLDD